MLQKKLPMQTIDALQLYDRMARVYPNKTISLTGHSLGGSLAEIVSGIRGAFAVTFNAYGIRDMFKSGTILKEDNIVNYVNEADLFTMVNGKNHIGEIYAVPNLGRNWLEKHFAEYMGVLSQRQKRSSKQIEVTAHRLHPKPLTSKEMLSGEAKDKLSNMLQGQKQKINNKFQTVENTLQQNLNSECVGSYPVSGYTREDGTKVSGYTRTCRARHNY